MNILYLHGLEGKLSEAKRDFLKDYGNVIAPDLDYFNDPNILQMLVEFNNTYKFDVVIGSSMGGFMAYNVANTIKCKALLFNPAILQKKVKQIIPKLNASNESTYLHFVLGGQDEVVIANSTLQWLSTNRLTNTDYKISIIKDLKHRIPLDIFKEEIGLFMIKNKF